jgi:rhamnosyltransferase
MPAEPIGPDGTLLHGLERIWAYAAQNDGYYPVIAMPTSLGEVYYGDALLQLRDVNAALFEKYGINVHRRVLDLIRTPTEPVQNTAFKESAKHISIGRIIKYRLMLKVCHGKRRKHYEKKLSDYIARFD